MDDINTYSKDGAICPYCGHLHHAVDDNWQLYDEATCDWRCTECNKDFVVSVYISHSWTSEKQDD